MKKMREIALGIMIGGYVANKAWETMSTKTIMKAAECLEMAKGMMERDEVKPLLEGDTIEDALTREEWMKAREIFKEAIKEYKKAYILISVSKIERNKEAMKHAVDMKVLIKKAMNELKEAIADIDGFLQDK